ncbi:Rho GDP-dissociation inhibitor [Tritrichomonas foetus]|uniref:Rho GDP-dissociation inhibitor n=1 Tax=Tritrichomonas foetus TaxID=1144522 RepID=A0A1J4JR35_9EUKA|nr:Rho GDP-dissociation inhibitor [Tritrichomonas foetus]|eukprot:OHT01210.1 Rho GDP-dissociation inhibitor [Tritrichomonas foetus]
MAQPKPATVDDFLKREDEDESVRKWKESLLGDAANADPALTHPKDDPRFVIPKEFKVVVQGGQTHTYNLEDKNSLNDLKKNGYKLTEGQTFHYEVTFLVHHDLVLGLKLKTKSKKMMAKQEASFDIGSYPPTIAPITKSLEECEVPTGMMTRGEYKTVNTIEDDMGRTHLKFESKFQIVKA